MADKLVTILGSGSSLGTYIPAMIMDSTLRRAGLDTDVEVIENYFLKEKREKINLHKKTFHKSFTAALISQKLVSTDRMPLDEALIDSAVDLWKSQNRRNFIVFSGYWVPVMEKYCSIAHRAGDISIDTCFMDAAISISWKNTGYDGKAFNPVRFFDSTGMQMPNALYISNHPPAAFGERKNRYVIHGGGWGLGTYQERTGELEEKGFLLDMVVYEYEECPDNSRGHRAFMVDPEWSPWHRDKSGRHTFPPFGEVKAAGQACFKTREDYHELYDVIRESRGIISKPGGATLMDSFSSATPLVMLEPYGGHEKANLDLWENKGFGIRYADWKRGGFSVKILEELHDRIMAERSKPNDYGEYYAAKIKCCV